MPPSETEKKTGTAVKKDTPNDTASEKITSTKDVPNANTVASEGISIENTMSAPLPQPETKDGKVVVQSINPVRHTATDVPAVSEEDKPKKKKKDLAFDPSENVNSGDLEKENAKIANRKEWLEGLQLRDEVAVKNLGGIPAKYQITDIVDDACVFGGESGDLWFSKKDGIVKHTLTMTDQEPVRYVYEPTEDMPVGRMRGMHDNREDVDLDPSADKKRGPVATTAKSSW